MKAAQVSSFGVPSDVIEIVDIEDPGAPTANEVVVDVDYAPINPADLLNIEGRYGAEVPALPMFLGAEGCGHISAVGDGVTHVKVGDKVLYPGRGAWRERVKASAQAVFALPEGVDPKQLSMLRVNPATAFLMLRNFVEPKPGNWVIQDAANSGVGASLIPLAKSMGLKSVNVVRRESLIVPLKALGADVVLVDGPDLEERVRTEIGGESLQLAIDAVGGSATARLAACLDEGGTVVNYGLLSGDPCSVEPRETVFRDITLRGFWLAKWFTVTPPNVIAETYGYLSNLLKDGTISVDVEAVYPFEDIAKALEHSGREGRDGKILISFFSKQGG